MHPVQCIHKQERSFLNHWLYSSLTLNLWSPTVHTRLAKSLEAPTIYTPVASKSTDITPAFEPTNVPLLSTTPENAVLCYTNVINYENS